MLVPDQQSTCLETDVPLSHSIIWRLQREFYIQRGIEAWRQDLVPNFITNNPFFAETYARIIFGFLSDCRDVSPANPLRIVELGAGTGKFAYLLLRRLIALLKSKGLPAASVRYCMTDCSPSLIQSWQGNPQLAEFVQSAMLQFALTEAGDEIPLLPADSQGFFPEAGPLVVIANYVFDSLPQDAFVIEDGQIYETLITTQSPEDAGDKRELSRLQFSYGKVKAKPDRYPEPSWNEVLKLYCERLRSATILFPCQALKALLTLQRMSDGRMLVLAADKGFTNEATLALCQGPPAFEFHASNCFSLMVNFDAISKCFKNISGEALLPDKHFSNLNICGFIKNRRGDSFTHTRAAYSEAQAAFGVDDLFTLFAWLNAHMDEMTLPQILAALRLTRWDPIAFMRMFPVLARQLRSATVERNDLRMAVAKIFENHYAVVPKENEIAFQCGVVLLELKFFSDALVMFQLSERIVIPSAATSYNKGLCLEGMGDLPEALKFMREACDLDPLFEPATVSYLRIKARLGTS